MSMWCVSPPEFQPNERVVSLVFHPPEIASGTAGTIVSPHIGRLYAVQLPSGELHTWFAEGELMSLQSGLPLVPGSYARIVSTEGHGTHVSVGMTVKIVKIIGQVAYYDLMIDGHGYHRWLAEFEIVPVSVFM